MKDQRHLQGNWKGALIAVLSNRAEHHRGKSREFEEMKCAHHRYIETVSADKELLQASLSALEAHVQQLDCELGELHDRGVWDGDDVERLTASIEYGKRQVARLRQMLYM